MTSPDKYAQRLSNLKAHIKTEIEFIEKESGGTVVILTKPVLKVVVIIADK
jgi:hypothetical protein